MGRVYAIKPDVVDRVLGSAIYSNWQKVQNAFIDEQSRAYTNESRYAGPWAASLKKQLQADLAFAEKCVDDYLIFLERTTASGTANVTEGEKILDILVLAISVLNSVNDLLDEMFALGILALFAVLEAASLQTEARALQALLKKLQTELEKAKREVTEAYVQTGINLAITAALAASGPLGWLALGAIGLGQMVADTYLGPSTSDSATWGSRANTTLGTAASASQKYAEATSKVAKVAKPAGKVIPVVGFVFDVNEIAVGYSNVDRLKALMAEVKTVHGQLIDKITLHRAAFASLLVKFDELNRQVQKRTDGWTAGIRQTLEAEMQRTGYRPRV
jgi:hypothetical protein